MPGLAGRLIIGAAQARGSLHLPTLERQETRRRIGDILNPQLVEVRLLEKAVEAVNSTN